MALTPINFSVPSRAPDPIEQALQMALASYARNWIEEPFTKRAERRELGRTLAAETRANERQRQNLVFMQNLSNENIGPSTQLTALARQDVGERSGQLLDTSDPITAAFLSRAEAELGSPLTTTRDMRSGQPLFNLPLGGPLGGTVPVGPRPVRNFVSAEEMAAARAAMAPASADQIATARTLAGELNRVTSRGVPQVPDIAATHTIRTPTGVTAPIDAPDLFGLGSEAPRLEGQEFTESTHPTSVADLAGVIKDAPTRLELLTRLGNQRVAWANYSQQNALYTKLTPMTAAQDAGFSDWEIRENGVGRRLTPEERNAVVQYGILSAATQTGTLSPAEREYARTQVALATRTMANARRAPRVLTAEVLTAERGRVDTSRGNPTDLLNTMRTIAVPARAAGVVVDERNRSVVEDAQAYNAIASNPPLLDAVIARSLLRNAREYNSSLQRGGARLSPEAEDFLQAIYRFETPANQSSDLWEIEGAKDLPVAQAAPRRGGILGALADITRPPDARRAIAQRTAAASQAAAGVAPAAPITPAPWTAPAPRAAGSTVISRVAPTTGYSGSQPDSYQRYYTRLRDSDDPAAAASAIRAQINRYYGYAPDAGLRAEGDPAAAMANMRASGDTALVALSSGSARTRQTALRQKRDTAIATLEQSQRQLAEEGVERSRTARQQELVPVIDK